VVEQAAKSLEYAVKPLPARERCGHDGSRGAVGFGAR
jgi:hypothetical protein